MSGKTYVFALLLIMGGVAPSACYSQQKTIASPLTVEEYVDQTPTVVERSLPALAEYLGRAGKTDKEKAYAIFLWIVKNIAYNTEVRRTGDSSHLDTSAEAVLATGSTICDGYANIFQGLAAKAGLEVVKIRGITTSDPFALSNERVKSHAWDAVKIKGAWQLVDCTWGAGYKDARERFVRNVDDYYFMPPPNEFIYGHFPNEAQWQLLKPAVTREQFDELIPVTSLFFREAIRPISHRKRTINAERTLEVILGARENLIFDAALLQDDTPVPDCTFVQRDGEKITISVVFPRAGAYDLRILMKGKQEKGAFLSIMEYTVNAKEGKEGKVGFPKILGAFPLYGAYLYTPMDRYLSAGSTVDFSLDVPGAEEVIVSTGDDVITLDHQGKRFSGTVLINKGVLMVAARIPGGTRYNVLLEYIGE